MKIRLIRENPRSICFCEFSGFDVFRQISFQAIQSLAVSMKRPYYISMKPVICNYYVTYRCDARCGYCTIWRENTLPASHESSPGIVCRNLGDVKLLGVKVVDFTGGEPLLYDGLPEVLAYAKNIGLITTVTTNGIRYLERASELYGLIDYLQFSLDAVDKEAHDSSRGVPSFDRVMEGIDVALMLDERPTFIHTVTDENLGKVPDVIVFARSMNIPLFLNPCFAYSGITGLSSKGAVELGEMARGPGVTLDRGFLRFLADGGNRRSFPRCLAISSTVVISPDDKLLLPCFHHKTKALPINGRLIALRNSSEVQSERKRERRYCFVDGCAINCYIRASLFRRFDRYFLPSIFSAVKYVYEYHRVDS